MILRNSLVVDPFDGCYDVGIYYENRGGKEWGFWLGNNGGELYTPMGGLIVIAPPSLGKWND